MTSVKPDDAPDEVQVALLMGLLLRDLREQALDDDWDGLRPSHFRVIGAVPPEGATITELAERVRMTKQGCGQFVTQLVDTGQLQIDRAPDDARVKVVTRTPLGRRTLRQVNARILQVEDEWARRVGSERYAVFRQVLIELTMQPAAVPPIAPR